VKEIGDELFFGCSSLKTITCPNHLADRLKKEYPDKQIVVSIPRKTQSKGMRM